MMSFALTLIVAALSYSIIGSADNMTGCNRRLYESRYFQLPVQNQSIMAEDIALIMSTWEWRSTVIIYDRSREILFQTLMSLWLEEDRDMKEVPAILEMTTTSIKMENYLRTVHKMYFPHINLLLLCNLKNTVDILSIADTIDKSSARLLDYTHKSFWLVVPGEAWLGAVKTASTHLQNVAILPYSDVRRDKHGRHYTIPLYPSCKVVCEDKYISSAVGMSTSRTWRWLSFDAIHNIHDFKSFMRLLYPNMDYGYNQHKLLVTTRESGICSTITEHNNISVYSGYCFDIIRMITKALNMSVQVIQSNNTSWGRSEGGHWTGMMGEIQRGDADIAVDDVSLHGSRVSIMDFVLPGLGTINTVILYRRNLERETSLFSFLDPFQYHVYLVLLASLLVIPMLYCGVERSIQETRRAVPISQIYYYFIGGTLQQGGSLHPASWTARAVVSTFWLSSICLAASYSAYLTASLTTSNNVQPFTDIKGLLQRDDYKVGMKGRGSAYDLLKESQDTILKGLWNKLTQSNKTDPSVIDSDLELQLAKVLTEKYAVIINYDLAEGAMTIDCRFAVLKEVLNTQQMSFGMRKGSPYKDDIERMLRRVLESGTIEHAVDRLKKRPLSCERIRKRSVSMEYMLGKLSVLVMGSASAFVVLLVEILVKRKTLKKNSNA